MMVHTCSLVKSRKFYPTEIFLCTVMYSLNCSIALTVIINDVADSHVQSGRD